ncbi:MAG: LapA family protein [Candidatus Eisenbacteria bacterium]
MWFLRNVIWLAVICLLFWFSYLNWEQSVPLLTLPGGLAFRDLHLVAAMFGAFIAGMVATLLANLIHVIRIHADRARTTRENQDLRKELSQLRNLPIEDLPANEGHESR